MSRPSPGETPAHRHLGQVALGPWSASYPPTRTIGLFRGNQSLLLSTFFCFDIDVVQNSTPLAAADQLPEHLSLAARKLKYTTFPL